jgi:nucleoside phosphorylase
MSASLRRCRRVAVEVHEAPLGAQARATARPRGVLGVVRALLAESGGQGGADPSGMLVTALGIGEFHQPRYLVLCGVCYGLDEQRQELCDVVVSQRVIDIDHRALIENRRYIRGVNVPPSPVLLSRLKASTLTPPSYGVHFGPMVASSTLLNSETERARLLSDVPHAVGGDMEGAAVYTAAATNGIEWIVVKGIADFGRAKTYAHQPAAAANAADFVVRMLQLGGLSDTTESRRLGVR